MIFKKEFILELIPAALWASYGISIVISMLLYLAQGLVVVPLCAIPSLARVVVSLVCLALALQLYYALSCVLCLTKGGDSHAYHFIFSILFALGAVLF